MGGIIYHVESPKYKMICLNSQKSSWFAFVYEISGKQSLTLFFIIFNNYSIFIKK